MRIRPSIPRRASLPRAVKRAKPTDLVNSNPAVLGLNVSKLGRAHQWWKQHLPVGVALSTAYAGMGYCKLVIHVDAGDKDSLERAIESLVKECPQECQFVSYIVDESKVYLINKRHN